MPMTFNNIIPPHATFSFLPVAGGAIAWHTKAQSITATSSTKAKSLATISATKVAKYLCLILQQIGFAQPIPTLLFEDNVSTIQMINAIKPTKCSCHINIQYYFALQDWRQQGHLKLHPIPDIMINPADDLTNALGWVVCTLPTCLPSHGKFWSTHSPLTSNSYHSSFPSIGIFAYVLFLLASCMRNDSS
jgi:hypothetical protein